jgi:hypothetical protein
MYNRKPRFPGWRTMTAKERYNSKVRHRVALAERGKERISMQQFCEELAQELKL